MLFTPLEQFQIISIFSFKIFCLDFSITNMLFINLIVLLIFSFIVSCFSSDSNYLNETGYYFIPNVWQTFIEIVYETDINKVIPLVDVIYMTRNQKERQETEIICKNKLTLQNFSKAKEGISVLNEIIDPGSPSVRAVVMILFHSE